jgi:hypothetical protein
MENFPSNIDAIARQRFGRPNRTFLEPSSCASERAIYDSILGLRDYSWKCGDGQTCRA